MKGIGSVVRACTAGIVASVLLAVVPGCGIETGAKNTAGPQKLSSDPLARSQTPVPSESLVTRQQAEQILAAMSLEEQVGQLVMAPINVAASSSESIRDFIANNKAGSVLLLGNWTGGTQQLAALTKKLQSYAPASNQLLIAADQEGGQVQHLQGSGFDRMPSAVWQGSQSPADLQKLAAGWGGQLKSAGVNVNLAPVVGTVQVQRASNAPIGALDRDFGHDAAGNAKSAAAFIAGMRDAGVMTSIKHYPGLGAVTGNTDFTANGILDTTTSIGGDEEGAFVSALKAQPEMVMMSLATYSKIDAENPAAFSSKLISGRLRGELGFSGVVTSDSMSAAAVASIPPSQLGVRFVEAGGDLVCAGTADVASAALQGMLEKARNSKDFKKHVEASVLRVITLKLRSGLAASERSE